MDPITRAQEAQRLLDEPLLAEAFAALDKSFVDKLRVAKTTEEMSHWVLSLQIAAKIKGWLVQQINSGKIELDERSKKQERK